jgi:hypothetical protein
MNKATTILGSLVLVSGLAFAGDDMDQQNFDKLDVNKDGTVTAAEAAADKQVMANFRAADVNNDGNLTKAEYQDYLDETEDAE